MTRFFAVLMTFAATLALSQISSASNADLINAALNQNLIERDQVTGTYLQNEAADRPELADTKRTDDNRIAVELESGLASSGGSRPLRDYDSRSRVYREPRVEAHLDKELKAIDRAFNRADSSTRVNPMNGG